MPGSYYLPGQKIADKLSGIQIIIQTTDHLIMGLLLTIQIPDWSGIQIPAVDDPQPPRLGNSALTQK